MYGELMPWSMWERMEIWNGFRGKVRGWIEEAILIWLWEAYRISIPTI